MRTAARTVKDMVALCTMLCACVSVCVCVCVCHTLFVGSSANNSSLSCVILSEARSVPGGALLANKSARHQATTHTHT